MGQYKMGYVLANHDFYFVFSVFSGSYFDEWRSFYWITDNRFDIWDAIDYIRNISVSYI